MNHASLFSGIGGAEIAATWLGWENLFHCEINPFGRKVLEYWYPNSISYEDITKTDFTEWRGKIDVLTAGFPCQPFSLAGSRKGADDDRYLWPQVVRALREIRPAWLVGENVAGILSMVQPGTEVEVGGGASLFGEDYRKRVLLRQQFTIEAICQDLEREGYEVQPFVIPACAVGAPHRRDRVWFVAHRSDAGVETLQCGWEDGVHSAGPASNPDLNRQRERTHQQVPVTERQRTSDYCACSQDGTASHPDEHRSPSRAAGEGTESVRRADIPQPGERRDTPQQPYGLHGLPRVDAHTDCELLSGRYGKRHEERKDKRFILEPCGCQTMWRDFPTQSPVRGRYDGISNYVVRYIKQEVYDAIKEKIRREDLSSVREAFQKKEIREQMGRLYEIPEPDLLLEVLQRTSEAGRPRKEQRCLSQFSEKTSERVLCYLRKHGTFASSPLGQKYKEQFTRKFGDSLPKLSHEIALATKKIVEECKSTATWVRAESIKALGNAWVPQVAYEIFRAIQIVTDEEHNGAER